MAEATSHTPIRKAAECAQALGVELRLDIRGAYSIDGLVVHVGPDRVQLTSGTYRFDQILSWRIPAVRSAS